MFYERSIKCSCVYSKVSNYLLKAPSSGCKFFNLGCYIYFTKMNLICISTVCIAYLLGQYFKVRNKI